MVKHDGSRMPFDSMNSIPYNPYCRYSYIFNYNPIYRAEPAQQSEILDFSFFNIEGVRGYYKIDENGKKIRLVNAEDIARGAGIVDIHFATSGEKYESPRWKRVNEYAQSRLPYLQKYADSIIFNYIQFPLNKESFIPIELAVQIIMCADSEQAKDFQALVSIKIAKEIDKLLDEKYSEELKYLKSWKEEAKESVNQDIALLKDMVYMGASLNRIRDAINDMDWL